MNRSLRLSALAVCLAIAMPAVAKTPPTVMPLKFNLPVVTEATVKTAREIKAEAPQFERWESLRIDEYLTLGQIRAPKHYDPGSYYKEPRGFGPIFTKRF